MLDDIRTQLGHAPSKPSEDIAQEAGVSSGAMRTTKLLEIQLITLCYMIQYWTLFLCMVYLIFMGIFEIRSLSNQSTDRRDIGEIFHFEVSCMSRE